MSSFSNPTLRMRARLKTIVAGCCLVAVLWAMGIAYLGTLRLEQESRDIVAQAVREARVVAATDAILLQRHFDALGTLAKLIAMQATSLVAAADTSQGSDDDVTTASLNGFTDTRLRMLNLQLLELVYELDVAALLVLDASGEIIAHGSRQGETPLFFRPVTQKAFIENISAFGGAETVVFSQQVGEPVFYIARAILQGSRTLGSVIVATTSRRVLEMLQHGQAQVIVADANGVVVAARDHDQMMKTLGEPHPALLASPNLLERYGLERFEMLPASFLSNRLDEVRTSGSVHAHQSMARSPLSVHVVHPVRELNPVERANLLATITLGAFGLFLILLAGFGLHHLGRMRDRATRDALTGLSNRHHADQLLPNLMSLHDRGRIPGLAIIAFDLDHFKHVNDTWGHAAGDLVLQRFAEILVRTARQTDLLFRFGGEEFLAVLAERDIDGARVFAQRVLEATERIDDIAPIPPRSITVSAGVVVRREHEPLDAATARADELLYAAKANGRNCVVVEPA